MLVELYDIIILVILNKYIWCTNMNYNNLKKEDIVKIIVILIVAAIVHKLSRFVFDTATTQGEIVLVVGTVVAIIILYLGYNVLIRKIKK